jgi:hypothetical protein
VPSKCFASDRNAASSTGPTSGPGQRAFEVRTVLWPRPDHGMGPFNRVADDIDAEATHPPQNNPTQRPQHHRRDHTRPGMCLVTAEHVKRHPSAGETSVASVRRSSTVDTEISRSSAERACRPCAAARSGESHHQRAGASDRPGVDYDLLAMGRRAHLVRRRHAVQGHRRHVRARGKHVTNQQVHGHVALHGR